MFDTFDDDAEGIYIPKWWAVVCGALLVDETFGRAAAERHAEYLTRTTGRLHRAVPL